MLIEIIRPHIEPGVRVYRPGDQVELADERARIWIHHSIARPAAAEQAQLPIAELAEQTRLEPAVTHETARRKPRRRESRGPQQARVSPDGVIESR